MKSNKFVELSLFIITFLMGYNVIIAQITSAQIDKTFDDWKDSSKPGGATAVIKDGRIVYLKGHGSVNIETGRLITPQTKFQLGRCPNNLPLWPYIF